MASEQQAREVKQRHSPNLMNQPGVCGVGVEKDDSGQFVIALHLDSEDPAIQEKLPKEIEGVSVKLVHSGPFRALKSG
jgi:hypothetical protein